MLYQEVAPHPQLAPYILDYWLFKVPPFEVLGKPEVQHIAPADGCVSLVLIYNNTQNLSMALVVGPSTDAVQTVVEPDTVYLGIRFIPGMFCALFDTKGQNLKKQKLPVHYFLPDLDLHSLLHQLSTDFSDFKLVDDYLLGLLAPKMPVKFDEEVHRAVRLILTSGGNIPIHEVLKQACLSERQLQKRFKRSTYLSMKELAKICRLRHAIAKVHLEQKTISDAVHEAGYFDQAHYNHDLHQATRRTPEEFYKHISQIEHINVKPVREKTE